MYCPNCGKKLRDGSRYCNQCGEPITSEIINNHDEAEEKDPYEGSGVSDDADQGWDGSDDGIRDNTNKKNNYYNYKYFAIILVIAIAAIIGLFVRFRRNDSGKTEIIYHNKSGKNSSKDGSGDKESSESSTEDNSTDTEDVTDKGSTDTDVETQTIPDTESTRQSGMDEEGAVEEEPEASVLPEGSLKRAEDIAPLEYGGHVYAIFNFHEDLGLETFDECEEFCERLGGHLAVINSEEENDAVYSYLLDNDRDHTFFGFTDQDQENDWQWVDGSPVTYTNWAKGQPNNKDGNENYAQFNGKNGGVWNDAKFGSESWRFLCEWE